MVKMFTHIISSSKDSLRGLCSTFRNEMAFRQEVMLTVPHAIILSFLRPSLWACIILSILLVLVFVAELLNTGIECVVDIASPDYHELAKRAKDAASAAVGLSLLAYFVVWAIVLLRIAIL